jgi:hypothetical protein
MNPSQHALLTLLRHINVLDRLVNTIHIVDSAKKGRVFRSGNSGFISTFPVDCLWITTYR